MVIVLITGYDGFDVALRKMAEAREIECPRMPIVFEHATEDSDLGIAIALAAALSTFGWRDAPEDYLEQIAKELGWRYRDMLSLLRKTFAPDRYTLIVEGRMTAADLEFEQHELDEFFWAAGVRTHVIDTLDRGRLGLIRELGDGADEFELKQPPGIVLKTKELFAPLWRSKGRRTKAS